jgi:hypothetical protein
MLELCGTLTRKTPRSGMLLTGIKPAVRNNLQMVPRTSTPFHRLYAISTDSIQRELLKIQSTLSVKAYPAGASIFILRFMPEQGSCLI